MCFSLWAEQHVLRRQHALDAADTAHQGQEHEAQIGDAGSFAVLRVQPLQERPRLDLAQILEQRVEKGGPVDRLHSIAAVRLQQFKGDLAVVARRGLPARDFQQSRLQVSAGLRAAYDVRG